MEVAHACNMDDQEEDGREAKDNKANAQRRFDKPPKPAWIYDGLNAQPLFVMAVFFFSNGLES
jgi:hypothetical protein